MPIPPYVSTSNEHMDVVSLTCNCSIFRTSVLHCQKSQNKTTYTYASYKNDAKYQNPSKAKKKE